MDRKTSHAEIFMKKSISKHGYLYDYSKTQYINSYGYVTITCRKHGDFTQIAGEHARGRGCRKCGHESIAKNTNFFIKKATAIHGDRYDYSISEYKAATDKIKIICRKHGEFSQQANVHLLGHNCQRCSYEWRGDTKKIPIDIFVKNAADIHGEMYDYSSVREIMVGGTRKLEVGCRIHGAFATDHRSHVIGGMGCPKCFGAKRYTTEFFVQRSKEAHGDRFDYSATRYTSSDSQVIIKCIRHDLEFLQTPHRHLDSKSPGCSDCKKEERLLFSKNQTMSFDEFLSRATDRHKDLYDYSKVRFSCGMGKVEIICKHHGSFWQRAAFHTYGNGCSKCINRVSLVEVAWLNAMGVSQEERQLFIKIDDRRAICADGYDTRTNTVYEFLGDYWHGNPAKYNSCDINKKIGKTFGTLFELQKTRNARIRNAGLNLVLVWELDFKNGIMISEAF